MAGANLIFGMGMIELGETFSLVQLVIDDMIVGQIKKMITFDLGMEMLSDPEWLHEFAGKGFPDKFWTPHKNRGSALMAHERKVSSRGMSIVEEAGQKVQSILTNYKPKPLPSHMVKRIKELIVEAGERRPK